MNKARVLIAGGLVLIALVCIGAYLPTVGPISSVQFNSNGVMSGSSGFVFTNGNVGIGTNSPQAKLHVRGGDTLIESTNATAEIRISAPLSTQPYVLRAVPAATGDSNDVFQIGIGFVAGGSQAVVGQVGLINQFERLFDNGGNPLTEWWIGVIGSNGVPQRTLMMNYQHLTGTIGWSTVGSTINAVQFGVIGKNALLDISDLSSRSSNLRFIGIGQPTWSIRDTFGVISRANLDGLGLYNETANRWLTIALASGGIAIPDGATGTDFATTLLKSISDGVLKITNTNDTSGLLRLGRGTSSAPAYSFYGSPATGVYLGTPTNQLRIATAGADRVIVSAAGNIGLGPDAPLALLHLNRVSPNDVSIIFQQNGTKEWTIGNPSGTTRLSISEAADLSVPRLTMLAGGNVGIGTTSPQAKLHVVGDAYIRTNTAPLDVTTTDFVLNTRYTNANRRALLAASFSLNAAAAGTAQVSLVIEHGTTITNKLTVNAGPLASLQTTEALTLMASPGAFYYFTNETSGAGGTATIVAGTSSVTGL